MLGVHWFIDAHDCASESMSAVHLFDVLSCVPDALGLARVGDAQVFERSDAIAGIVLLSESHFSVHVRPDARALHADLFSCRPFDHARALEILREIYGFDHHVERIMERGKR